MSARYDLEALLLDLKNVCISGLNTKLASIAAEKSDNIPLSEISNDAYFFQRIEKNRASVYPAFLLFTVEDPTADGIGPHTLENYLLNFIVVLKDTADADLFTTRLLRYSRALKEIFEEASIKNKIRARIQIASLSPQAFAIQDLTGTFRGVGVQIRTVIG